MGRPRLALQAGSQSALVNANPVFVGAPSKVHLGLSCWNQSVPVVQVYSRDRLLLATKKGKHSRSCEQSAQAVRTLGVGLALWEEERPVSSCKTEFLVRPPWQQNSLDYDSQQARPYRHA